MDRRNASATFAAPDEKPSSGKESYSIVAAFNLFEYRDEAPLFRRLSDRFEECVCGLNLVKRELQELQGATYRQLRVDLGLGS
jgi:hypothetical protein